MLHSVGGCVFSAGGGFALSVYVISGTVQRCTLRVVVQSQEKKPHCLCDLQISSSLLSDELKQVTRYYSHGLKRGHLPFTNRIGGGVTPRESVHSQDGATVLTQIVYCRIDVENSAIPSLHLQVTCDTHLPGPTDHEHKHINVITENVDSFSTTPGCIEHVLDEGDISFIMSDNTICSADHLNVISYVVCAQELT